MSTPVTTCTPSRHVAGGPAGSGGDIQNTLACTRIQSLGGMRERVRDGKAHLVVVLTAPTPHGGGRLVVGKNSGITGFHLRGLLSAGSPPNKDVRLFQTLSIVET